MGNGDSLADRVDRDGYAIVEGLFTPAEIASLRETCDRFFATRPHMRSNLGRNLPNAVQYVPDIHWLYSHPRVIAAFREALGSDDVVFTRHCDIAQNRLSAWHKDTGHNPPYFSGDFIHDDSCRVYKMAVYLEDHVDNDHGLWVRRGSHHIPNLESGEPLHLPTRAGDAVVFDVRLTHSGQRPDRVENALSAAAKAMPSGGHRRHQREIFVRAKDLYWKLRRQESRTSIFFTYGLPNERTDEFSARNMTRQGEQNIALRGLEPVSCDRLFADLEAAGVRVFHPADTAA